MPPPRRADPITEIIARRVRKIRREREWTAAELAQRLTRAGLPAWDRATVSRYEAFGRESTSVTVLFAFATALDVSPLDLVAPENGDPVPLVPASVPVDAATARQWIVGGPVKVKRGTAAPRAAVGGTKTVESVEDRLAALEARIGAV